jgi:hypothetical protein
VHCAVLDDSQRCDHRQRRSRDQTRSGEQPINDHPHLHRKDEVQAIGNTRWDGFPHRSTPDRAWPWQVRLADGMIKERLCSCLLRSSVSSPANEPHKNRPACWREKEKTGHNLR